MKRVFLAVNLPRGLHITLHFLGNQNERAIRKINEIASEVVKSYGPIKIATGGTGFFPNRRAPKVMYLKVIEKNGLALKSIREKIKRELVKSGFEVDHRPWVPHVTIAWVDGNLKVSATKVPSTRIYTVKSIDLMQSHLLNSGSEYELIQKHPLAKNSRS